MPLAVNRFLPADYNKDSKIVRECPEIDLLQAKKRQ